MHTDTNTLLVHSKHTVVFIQFYFVHRQVKSRLFFYFVLAKTLHKTKAKEATKDSNFKSKHFGTLNMKKYEE